MRNRLLLFASLILIISLTSITLFEIPTAGKATDNLIRTPHKQAMPIANTGITTYIYSGKLIASKSSSGITYHYQDLVLSNRISTTQSGILQSKTVHYPFGKNVLEESNAESKEKYQFTGKEKDNDHVYYYGARYYNSNIGRFLSVDPARSTFADYDYAHNNPVKIYDKTGRASPTIKEMREQPLHAIDILPLDMKPVAILRQPAKEDDWNGNFNDYGREQFKETYNLAGFDPIVVPRGSSPAQALNYVKNKGRFVQDISLIDWGGHGWKGGYMPGGAGTDSSGHVTSSMAQNYYAPMRKQLSPLSPLTWIQNSCSAGVACADGSPNIAQATFDAIPQIDSLYASGGDGSIRAYMEKGRLTHLAVWTKPGFDSQGNGFVQEAPLGGSSYLIRILLNPDSSLTISEIGALIPEDYPIGENTYTQAREQLGTGNFREHLFNNVEHGESTTEPYLTR